MDDVTPSELRRIAGFLVADVHGHRVGRVECPMYGTAPDVPDALSVRAGILARHRFIVPTAAIVDIDDRSEVVGLRLERNELRRFL